jgi:hypothetical protein
LIQILCEQTALHNAGFKRVEELQAAVDKLSLSVQRARAKILGIELPAVEQEVHIFLFSFMFQSNLSLTAFCLIQQLICGHQGDH